MTSAPTVLLDNEAVQSLRDTRHPKHRRALSILAALLEPAGGRASGSRSRVIPLVPTVVRVEAGWDRRDARSAVVNALRIRDVPLDTALADSAATIATRAAVSPADAHIAAVAQATDGPCVVVTSDVGDVQRLAATLDLDLRVVRL
jgi:predicted nucleic acid-binding protein